MNRLEIACFNLESALIAAQSGADRIEFCADYASGGITPSIEDFKKLKAFTSIPVYIMIRPRGGDFVYSESEIETMKTCIADFKKAGADGFVFGLLNTDNTLAETNQELGKLAGDTPCTFHRAFDKTPDLFNSLEQLIDWGFKTVLTSGGSTSALAGTAKLGKLLERSQGRIQILPGGGIRSTNIAELADKVTAGFFHSSGIIDGSEIASATEILELKAAMNP